jgi:acyl carrier protein
VNTIEEFVTLLHDELGLVVSTEEVHEPLDTLPVWDSLHMLAVLTMLERRKGVRIMLPEALEATTLHDIYAMTVTT